MAGARGTGKRRDGTNTLIKQGAALVENAGNVLRELMVTGSAPRISIPNGLPCSTKRSRRSGA